MRRRRILFLSSKELLEYVFSYFEKSEIVQFASLKRVLERLLDKENCEGFFITDWDELYLWDFDLDRLVDSVASLLEDVGILVEGKKNGKGKV